MISKFTLLLILMSSVWATRTVFAQQLPMLSEYTHNAGLINPAMTGWENITAITAGYRHQWTGMNQAPRTASLGFRGFMDDKNMGIGGHIMHDQTGPTSYTGLNFMYAYHLKFKPEISGTANRNRLSIGLSLSALQYRLRGEDLLVNDLDDQLLVGTNRSRILPDAGMGIFYYNDLFYMGFSVPQMISMKVRFEDVNGLSNIRRTAHFYVNAGAKIEINNQYKSLEEEDEEIGRATTKKIKTDKQQRKHYIIPSFWIKYAPTSPLNINFNVRYMWDQVFGIGLGYTTDGTLIGDFDVNIAKHMRLGYAFSIGVNGLSQHLGTNHEISLTYIFKSNGKGWLFPEVGNKKREKKVKDPAK
ncbi:MAG: type IX secretion system membrane protein PorP/SprF [Saprospiraceae bacterium]|nr:type IX secretion system membrane protein PorP/SprF [Saprospiraceae bacterium]